MVHATLAQQRERLAIIRWTARMGAVTAEALACREGTSVASARSRLVAAERCGLVSRRRPLAGYPALYTITRAGLRRSGLEGFAPSQVSSSNALHMIVCAEVAVALEFGYPDHDVMGERELRRLESERGGLLASARLGGVRLGGPLIHRPDLVLWSTHLDRGRPVAVEVELTVKAPRRLAEICRAWARARHVAGVLYIAPPSVEPALQRAIERVQAAERIVVAPLAALARAGQPTGMLLARAIPAEP
jgi:hypothetical protein